MSTLIKKENIGKYLKYIGYFILACISIYLSVYLVKMLFNLGVHTGTFIRLVYRTFCY